MTNSPEVDILIWQDLVVDEAVATPVVGEDTIIDAVGLLSRGHPLQEMVSGVGTVEWAKWDGLNRLLWTAVRTPSYLVLAMDALVVAPAALPGVGDAVEFAGYLHVVHVHALDELGPVDWQDWRSTWRVSGVQRTDPGRDFLVRAATTKAEHPAARGC